MATGTPVVISRIQNRRGLQQDFDNLYPGGQPGSGPSVLQPGEIALCTDTGRVFIGTTVNTLSGYFIELGSGGGGGSSPLVVSLPPASVWTQMLAPITCTPFHSILYSVVNIVTTDPNAPGTIFSKSGELVITSTTTSATLSDTSTEINSTVHDISFRADLVGGNIMLYYKHDFDTPVTFSTTSIIWSAI